MKQEDKIKQINQAIEQYFQANTDIDKIPAKDLMHQFIKAGIFEKDHRNGLPIRSILRELDENKQLDLIPSVQPERKKINTNWFFIRTKN
jgi:hypothetical protein